MNVMKGLRKSVTSKKSILLIEFLVGITLKIELKNKVLFFRKKPSVLY